MPDVRTLEEKPQIATAPRMLSGVKIIDGEPYMKTDSEERYVFGLYYYNPETKEIRNT